jgi:uncharacterized RDD family membrane protein YckC
MSERVGPAYYREDYAGFVRRSAALVIDFLILLILYSFLPEIWLYAAPDDWVTLESFVWLEFGIFLFAIAYCFGLRLTIRGTLGYRIMRIQYAYMLGGKPTWLAVLYRAAITLFLMLTFGLDHFWILFDERKQAWHDKVSGFYVVKRRAQPRGTQRIVQQVINFMMLSFVVWEPERDIRLARPIAKD